MRERVVVIGGGTAAAECVAELRMAGFDGSITLVSDDSHAPYSRPALSKAFLLGKATAADIAIRPEATYAAQDIDLRCGVTAESVDRAERRVHLADGDTLAYDKLVIATGGRARRLPGAIVVGSPTIHYLRGLEDADALRRGLRPGARLVVVGGGYVGLEAASAARGLGASVTVVEAMPRLLARVTSPPVSEFFLRLHLEEGVAIRLDANVVRISGATSGGPASVELSTREQLDADVVLVGIGLVPNVELAQAAGLEVADGVIVDEYCRTSDPAIFAAGDCTNHPCFETGGRRRLESISNAREQGKVAASSVMEKHQPNIATPWFWSEQYDVLLQSVGISQAGDEVVIRGSIDAGRSFAVFYLRERRIRAADVVSSPREFGFAKKLVGQRSLVNREQLEDPSVPLKGLLGQTATEQPALAQ